MLKWKWIRLDDYEERGENGRWIDRKSTLNTKYMNLCNNNLT